MATLLLALLVPTASAGEELTFRLRGFLEGQTALTGFEDAPPSASIALRRARTQGFIGLWGDRANAMLQIEYAGGPRVLDARVDLGIVESVTLSVGFEIVPYSREWNTPLPIVALGDRSVANNTLTPGRRLGGYLMLEPTDAVTIWAGLYDATERAIRAGGLRAPVSMVRIQLDSSDVKPADELPGVGGEGPTGVSVGLAVMADSVERIDPFDGGGDVEPRIGGTVDLAFHTGGFATQVAAFSRLESGEFDGEGVPIDSPMQINVGTTAQISQFVVPRTLNLTGRLSGLGDLNANAPVRWVPELGAGWHVHGSQALVQVIGIANPPGTPLGTLQAELRGQLWL